MDNNYDLIVCNPPWLNASFIFSQNDLDNATYDPDHRFLKSCFNFASKLYKILILENHLTKNNQDARFLIIFSDLGSILETNKSDIIEQLALQNKLKITNITTKLSDLKVTKQNDPLKNFKKESKVVLYELKRI